MLVTLRIEAAQGRVWRALTVDRSRWWPEMVFDAVVGASLVETWVEDGEVLQASGTITTVDAPRLLAFEWSEPAWQGNLTVRVRLAPVTQGTEVSITEEGFASIQAQSSLASEHEEGWLYHLERLRDASIAPEGGWGGARRWCAGGHSTSPRSLWQSQS